MHGFSLRTLIAAGASLAMLASLGAAELRLRPQEISNQLSVGYATSLLASDSPPLR